MEGKTRKVKKKHMREKKKTHGTAAEDLWVGGGEGT